MDIVIEEVTSTIRAVDGDALLHPNTIAKLIHAAIAAMEDKQAREKRRRADACPRDDDGQRDDGGND